MQFQHYIFLLLLCLADVLSVPCDLYTQVLLKIPHNYRGLFIGITTMPNSSRQSYIDEIWGSKMHKEHKNVEIAFLTKEGTELQGYEYIHIPKKLQDMIDEPIDRKRDRDILSKKYLAAKYFLENTNKSWCWIIGDDVSIDTENIEYMIDKLNDKYDTTTDIVQIGHCVYNYYNGFYYYYLQGGSGFILSRRAAEIFVNVGLSYIKGNTISDDIKLGKLRKDLGLSIPSTASQFMFGHAYNHEHLDFSHLKKCPKKKKLPNSKCYGQQLFNIKDLIGIHESNITFNRELTEKIFTAKTKYPDVKYYFDDYILYFCK